MNKVYKVIWNRTKQCYIVVSEFAKQAGKVRSTYLFAAMGKTTTAVGLGAALLFVPWVGGGINASAATGNQVIGGDQAEATGDYSTVSGGHLNHAEGSYSSVSGGSKNHAKGTNSSVSGGADNQAFGQDSSVSGGGQNMATGEWASVTGGFQNQAGGNFATVSGGTGNKAFGSGSIVIGGSSNVTGKVAVGDAGNILTDANGNQRPAFDIGVDSVAIGGLSSSVQGNFSVGIAGGSTSAKAASGLAAGKQATVTMANGVAIGYESTASVIDQSRPADAEGRIVSFGHQEGDVYYTVDPHNHTVTEKRYNSAAYNRLVNVAYGIDDHDVVVMEQLKNAKADAVATAKKQIKVNGDEFNVHAETINKDDVQTTTISLKPKITLQDTTADPTGAKKVVLDGTAGTISAGLSTDQQNYISLNGTAGLAQVGAVKIGNQDFTYDYQSPAGRNEDGTLKLQSNRANAKGSFVTGLSNKTWTPGKYASGRAATEDQLEQAGRHFLSIKTGTNTDGTTIAENTLANYYNDGATGSASMAFGVETKASGDQSLAMGAKSSASGLNSLAIGYGNEAAGTKSVAVGHSTHASGNFSVAMGVGSSAGTANTDTSSTTDGAAVAVGFMAQATKTGSSAYGYNAQAVQNEGTALGVSSVANVEGGVAVGAHSIADVAKGAKGYLAGDSDMSTAWVSTAGAMSLGGSTKDEKGNAITVSRQITNLAAGSADSDAVNVAQLKAVESKGLNFQGNDTTTSVHLNQGGTLQIQGSGRKDDNEYSTQNVKVLMDTAHNRLSIALDKNPDFDSVTAGTAPTDADGGKAGYIKIVGADSKNVNKATTIKAGYATSPELSGTNGTGRISYTDWDGTAHTVATLGDGLNFAGDTGKASVALDKTLDVKGGATDLATGNNIGVTANGSALSLKLAKNVTGLDTVTAGGVKMGTQTDGNDTTKSGDYLTGLDNTTWTVGQTQLVKGRAATEDQLKSVSDVVNSNKTQITTNADNIDKGLNFSASNKVDGAYKTVKKNLGDTVAVRANDAQDGHTYKTDNLTTEIDDTGIITVKMDTQLTADKVTVGKDGNAITLDGSNGNVTTGSSTLGGTGLTIANGGPSVTTSGISGGNKQITDVKSGASSYDDSNNPIYGTDTNAANIGDVKKIAAKTVTVSGDGTNTRVDKTTNADGTVDYKVSLNDSVTLGSDAGKRIALDGNAGTISAGDKITLNGANGTATIGGATLGNDGTDTYLTGLTNKTWDPNNITHGRAATEDQLQTVSNTVNAGWKAQVNGTDVKTVIPTNNTLNFVAGDNIALTQNGDIQIATTPNVNFTTARVGGTRGTDGTYTGGIYLGSQAGGGANSGTGFYITGLQNTNWNANSIVSGRAATEDQLQKAITEVQTGILASDNYVTDGAATEDTANPGHLKVTLNEKNGNFVSVSGLHDYYVTGGSVSTATKTSDGVTSTTATLTLNKNNGTSVDVDLSGLSNMDYHLVENSASGSNGAYSVDANGDVKLTVASTTDTVGKEITISGLASKADVYKGLIFKASAPADGATSLTHKAQLGDSIGIFGGNKQDGHTYNTNNITTTIDDKGDIRVLMDDNLVVGSKDTGVDGSVKATGQGGAYLKMNGADGSLRMGDASGNFAALIQNYGSDGTAFLNSRENGSPRLQYWAAKSGQSEAEAEKVLHTIATLDDGMKFAGDDAKADPSKTVSTTLNSKLNITGGADTNGLTDGNIGVVKNDAGDGLVVKLKKDLSGMGTISFAPTETGKQGIKIGSQNVGASGKGTNAQTGDYITGLTNTKWNADDIVSGRAATEDQLQQVAKSIVNGSATGGGFGLSADKADSTNATEVKQDLGSSIKITTGGDTNLSTQADSANKAIVVSLNKELNLKKTTLTDGTTGATTVVDGNGVVITPKQGSDADKVKLTTDGLSNGGKQITNVQSGLYDTTQNKPVDISTITTSNSMLQNAATIGDLQTVSNGVKTDLTATGLNFKGNNEDTTVHRNLGETLTIQGTGADNRVYDGGANVQVLADDTKGTLTIQLDRDLNAHTLTLGKASTGTETGETGTLILNGKNKDNGMSPVSIGVTYRENKDNEAMKTAMSRITYTGGNGNDHTVATLEDGLQLAGDNGMAIDTTLNKKVTIKGGAKTADLVDSSDATKNNNIGVTTSTDDNGNTTLSLQLAKDITGLNTVTAGTVVMGNQTVISDQKKSETGSFVAGLGNTTWDSKDYVSGRAATEDQLKSVSDSIQSTVEKATFSITAGGEGKATDATITKKVGESIRIFGDAPKVSGGGDGDGWDPSKANILTKVKKDNYGDSYVSVELQDHLEVGTHAGTDTDGTTITGVDGSMQFKGASAKEVNITGDTGVTLSNNGSTAAALRQDNGAGYLDLTGTMAGTKASVSVHTGAKNLAQQDQTRLTYMDQDSKAHDVATLDDGLIFAGDIGNVSQALNSTVKISGGVSNASDLSSGNNIGVTAGDGTLKLQLAKNLTGIDSITGLKNTTIGSDFATQGRAATEEQLKLMQSNITSSITQSAQGGGFALTSDEKGDDKIVKQDLGKAIQIKGDTTYKADGSVEKEGNIKTSIDNGAIKVGLNKDVDLGTDGSIKAGGVTINNKGIDAGNKNITNVKSGIVNHNDSDNSNAANIGDVKKLAGEAAQGAVDSLGTRDFTGDDGEKISRKLGESMKLSGGADTSKLTDKNIGVVKNADGTGLDIKLSSELKGLTSVTTGNSTLNNDGLTINNSEGKAGTTITNSGIKIAANGDNTHVVEISNSNVSMGGQQIHDVAAGTSATDAVNVGQLSMFANNVGSAINKLDNRVNRVGAGASALAALHPLDFDPDDKWDFAGGFGHYKNANAAAIGAYYRPNEDTMFSIGGSFGGGENMLNAGVSFKLGQGNHVSTSRTMMAKEIESLKAVVKEQNEKLQENENLRAKVDKEIAELKAMVQQLAARR